MYSGRKTLPIAAATFNVTFDHDQNDEAVFFVNQATATVNLPSAVGFQAAIFIKKAAAAAGTITITPFGSQTIDGNSSYSLASQYKYVKILSDGANWQIAAAN